MPSISLLLCLIAVVSAPQSQLRSTTPAGATLPSPPTTARRSTRLLAGMATGVISAALLQPLEVVKTRIQKLDPSDRVSLLGILRRVWLREGARALWAGALHSVFRLAGGIGLYFLFLSEAQQIALLLFGELHGWHAAIRDLVLGGLARTAGVIIFSPINVLKTRAEMGRHESLRSLVSSEGLSGCFAGLRQTLLRDVPYSAMSYLFLRSMQSSLAVYAAPLPSLQRTAIASASAATIATLLTQPADVLRTEMVTRRRKDQYIGTVATARYIVAQRGPAGLLAGVQPQLARKAVQQVITWVTFEALAV
jgi:solute carrier family 25 protein 38